MGADELSLLTMGQSIRAGFLPFEEHWDVRLPSAYADDAPRAVLTLRWLAWFQRVADIEAGEQFARMAILVRH